MPFLLRKKCCCGTVCEYCAVDFYNQIMSVNGNERVVVGYCFEPKSMTCFSGSGSYGDISEAWFKDQLSLQGQGYSSTTLSVSFKNSLHVSAAAPSGYVEGYGAASLSCQRPTFPFARTVTWGAGLASQFRRVVNESGDFFFFNTAETNAPWLPYSAFQHPKCFMRWTYDSDAMGTTFFAELRSAGGTTICRVEGVLVVDLRLVESECHPECVSQTVPDPTELCGVLP